MAYAPSPFTASASSSASSSGGPFGGIPVEKSFPWADDPSLAPSLLAEGEVEEIDEEDDNILGSGTARTGLTDEEDYYREDDDMLG